MSTKTKGIAAALLSGFLFGITPMITSITYRMGSNAQTMTFYRNLLAVPLLALIMVIARISFRITAKELGMLALIGIFFRASTTLMLYASYDFVGIGTATTLHFLYPFFAVLTGLVFFRERMTWTKAAALLLATGGIAVTGTKGEEFSLFGVVLALASALTYAIYMIALDRSCLRTMDPYKTAFYMGIFNAAAIALFDLPTQKIVYVLPVNVLGLSVVVALCTSCLAVALVQKGICCLGAGNAAIFTMVEPITCVLTGWLILKEEMTPAKTLSCILILTAVVVMILSDRRKTDLQNPASSDKCS